MTDLPELKMENGRIYFDNYLDFILTVTLYCVKIIDNLKKEKEQ